MNLLFTLIFLATTVAAAFQAPANGISGTFLLGRLPSASATFSYSPTSTALFHWNKRSRNNGLLVSLSSTRGGGSNGEKEEELITEPKATLVGINKNNDDDDDNKTLPTNKTVSHLISLFWQMASPYYQESKSGRWLFWAMIGLTLLNSGVSVAFSYLGKDFWNALSSKDVDAFYDVLKQYVPALLVGAPVATYYRFQRAQLAVSWREWMTDRTLQIYSSQRVYYALERGKEIDNPDQRYVRLTTVLTVCDASPSAIKTQISGCECLTFAIFFV